MKPCIRTLKTKGWGKHCNRNRTIRCPQGTGNTIWYFREHQPVLCTNTEKTIPLFFFPAKRCLFYPYIICTRERFQADIAVLETTEIWFRTWYMFEGPGLSDKLNGNDSVAVLADYLTLFSRQRQDDLVLSSERWSVFPSFSSCKTLDQLKNEELALSFLPINDVRVEEGVPLHTRLNDSHQVFSYKIVQLRTIVFPDAGAHIVHITVYVKNVCSPLCKGSPLAIGDPLLRNKVLLTIFENRSPNAGAP